MRNLILSLFMAAGLVGTTGVGSFACDAMKQQTELGSDQQMAQGTTGTGTSGTGTGTTGTTDTGQILLQMS